MKIRAFACIVAVLATTMLAVTGCKGSAPHPVASDSLSSYSEEGVARMPQEQFELICIQDSPQMQDAKIFKGASDTLLQRLLPDGRAESSVNVFLVATDAKQILFDAGLGVEKGGLLRERLAALHVHPEDVDAVILTHFHPDHIGGLIFNDGPAFPHADIYASLDEYEAWVNGSQRKRNQQVLDMLACYANRLNLFQDGDTLLDAKGGGTLPVIAHYAVGHTPGHSVYEVGKVLITGDLIHAMSLQVKHPEISTTYDFNIPQAMKARKYWLQYARDNQMVFAGMHLPLPGTLE